MKLTHSAPAADRTDYLLKLDGQTVGSAFKDKKGRFSFRSSPQLPQPMFFFVGMTMADLKKAVETELTDETVGSLVNSFPQYQEAAEEMVKEALAA